MAWSLSLGSFSIHSCKQNTKRPEFPCLFSLFPYSLVSFLGLYFGLVLALIICCNTLIFSYLSSIFSLVLRSQNACFAFSANSFTAHSVCESRRPRTNSPYMPLFRTLPIMPKEIKPHSAKYTPPAAPYPTPSSNTAGPRNAAIWSTTDDEVLLRARVSGLNWQPIASKYFPNKTANACRKRHERLIERRHVEDWDAQKLELLAQEYMAVRKEMWEVLASRVGERWSVVEAKVSTC